MTSRWLVLAVLVIVGCAPELRLSDAPDGSDGSSSGGGGTAMASGSSASSGGNLMLSMIDDMEDMDAWIIVTEGRMGKWYPYHDMSAGMQTSPVPMTALSPPRGSSMYAAHTMGSGFTDWGAGFGFNLSDPTGMKPDPYDASKYAGVHFFAKSTGPLSVRLNIGDIDTNLNGGKCIDGGMPGGMVPPCSDDFGEALNLTDQWQEFTFKFADMTQDGWAKQNLTAIDTKTLYSIHFQVKNGIAFDIWIDDIAFFR